MAELFHLITIIEHNISNATSRHTADTLIDGRFVMVPDCITYAEVNNLAEKSSKNWTVWPAE